MIYTPPQRHNKRHFLATDCNCCTLNPVPLVQRQLMAASSDVTQRRVTDTAEPLVLLLDQLVCFRCFSAGVTLCLEDVLVVAAAEEIVSVATDPVCSVELTACLADVTT